MAFGAVYIHAAEHYTDKQIRQGIQELCCQQREMYSRKSHPIESRIVSITQRHICPIVRRRAG